MCNGPRPWRPRVVASMPSSKQISTRPTATPRRGSAPESRGEKRTMFYDAAKRDHGLPQDPLKSLIVPRPIGWISTIDGQGRVNLAPYSFYNGVSEFPPMVYFAITGTYGDNPTKQSRMNAKETGEFLVNMVSADLADKMNITTAMVAYGVDEMKLAGLTPEPCRFV